MSRYTGKDTTSEKEPAMEPLQYTATTTSAAGSLALSALPGAPVVAEPVRTPRVAASRARLAASLHRLADAVAPAAGRPRRHAWAGNR
jgi:hypothetical protein